MDIQEYTQSVIEQLIEAIKASQEKYCNGCDILPPIINPSKIDKNNEGVFNDISRQVQQLKFTINTQIETEKSQSANGSVNIKVANGDIRTIDSTKDHLTNSISFSIPIMFPAVENHKVNKRKPPKRPKPQE